MNENLRLGIDIGSTTVKTVVYDTSKDEILFQKYMRHHAEQRKTVVKLLEEIMKLFPGQEFRIGICGSGGKHIAELIGSHYIQEVVANSCAIRAKYPQTRTAVELGGQDAKIIFFYFDEEQQRLMTSDMRMNGSCAGGTGAFIDEIAALLKVPVEEFEQLASKGKKVHSISGRCGVFAKTDIQGLLNQSVSREDIALSAFHAIVKQTIGGLAQGLELKPPVIFEGGPLNFNPTLVEAFCERLNLKPNEAIFPQHPDTIVALGCAIAVDELFPESEYADDALLISDVVAKLEAFHDEIEKASNDPKVKTFFDSEAECAEWREAHKIASIKEADVKEGDTLDIYIGIDAGSTTSKLVFMNRDEEVIDSFYANNEGDPIRIVKQGLSTLYKKYNKLGVKLNVLGLGTTGYGELLLGTAFGADYHTVETVAHSTAARKYMKDVSFILDIGGQDMKGIWVSDDIVTNITLNEACSSGCGSFLQNFATSLNIPLEKIADAAFASKHPANLGSRCTVFMNSTIITEQKNGRNAQDIMAGLCRSIIENVFTKVVRISDTSSLGKNIMVQGGTFKNDAVLRALEQYLNVNVNRAPYPGEMGAIGVALLTKRHDTGKSNFIGFENLSNFKYSQKDNVICNFCENHCNRTIVQFPNGTAYITGNRCPRGESLDSKPAAVKNVPDLFLTRETMLFKKYKCTPVCEKRNIKVGMPRTLEFWDSMPFWSTFWECLGYDVVFSDKSSREYFEKGLPFVASDTVCFPAKLAHGHIQNLVEKKVDFIFMPMIMNMPPKDTEKKSNYVCAVVKGYPLIIYNQENPSKRWGVKFEKPMFHWYSERDRFIQLAQYMEKVHGINKSLVKKAFDQGMNSIRTFKKTLVELGDKIREDAKREGKFAVVLAGRPYHTDALVSHDLSRVFTKEGIPVLTVDSLSGLEQADLRYTRAEVTNNFHTRMLSGALLSAKSDELEYAQIVSFGCGHDAILSDEIIRITKEVSDKAPLILKMDEGGASNSLNIRVKSFIETIAERRLKNKAKENLTKPLTDAYPQKFLKKDRKIKTVLVPNVSVAFCKLLSATLTRSGLKAEPLPLGSINEIRLGKKYVHNDTCFPAQMVIGEAISVLQSGKYNADEVAIGMAKYQGDCRLTHYSALLRRALDAAGFSQVPIVSTDPVDYKEMHPGIKLGNTFNIATVWAVVFMDIFEELRRKIRPYEINKGETNRIFDSIIDRLAEALKHSTTKAMKVFKDGIDEFCTIKYDRSNLRPRVFITGEYLVTFHPGSNFFVEEYLEKNGMEVILPRMINVFWKDFHSRICEMKDYHVKFPIDLGPFSYVAEGLINFALNKTEKIAVKHPLYQKVLRLPKLAVENNHVMERTFLSGEGWLIPGEIREFARDGVKSFVILQPFGCLPNHITGRGSMKKIKEEFPAIQILPLDLDPDTSFANVENRLQMLIMNAKTNR
ncbi:MAG: acyl-CoA dehydratase activase [Treponema sp.]|nr:acyl-CoA dehydratase activase [Treponema sp.]